MKPDNPPEFLSGAPAVYPLFCLCLPVPLELAGHVPVVLSALTGIYLQCLHRHCLRRSLSDPLASKLFVRSHSHVTTNQRTEATTHPNWRKEQLFRFAGSAIHGTLLNPTKRSLRWRLETESEQGSLWTSLFRAYFETRSLCSPRVSSLAPSHFIAEFYLPPTQGLVVPHQLSG